MLSHKHHPAGLLTLTVALLLLSAGCTTTTADKATGAPLQSPTDPAHVIILHSEPTSPNIQLGRVTLEVPVYPAPSAQKIEARLREGAARLGADAVVLAYDQTRTLGATASDSYWGDWLDPAEIDVNATQTRLVIGIAIKYQQVAPTDR
ncbi:MAG: hypothetical protein ACM359_13410 [Bacillota bacterium]